MFCFAIVDILWIQPGTAVLWLSRRLLARFAWAKHGDVVPLNDWIGAVFFPAGCEKKIKDRVRDGAAE
jgi:hypothetical protein